MSEQITQSQVQTSTAATASMTEARLIRETGIDAKVAAIVEPAIIDAGFRLVRVRLSGLNGKTLQIMAERPDGTITVEDCEVISRALSPILDVEDPIDGNYHLEISSPGIDRPLVRKSDFSAWEGHVVRLETTLLHENRKKFRGRIIEVDEQSLKLEADQASYGAEASVVIPFELIAEARLILTDELIRDALRRDKALREGRIPGDDLDSSVEQEYETGYGDEADSDQSDI